jgi:hypothetical protein
VARRHRAAGRLDDFRILDRACTPEEIRTMAGTK